MVSSVLPPTTPPVSSMTSVSNALSLSLLTTDLIMVEPPIPSSVKTKVLALVISDLLTYPSTLAPSSTTSNDIETHTDSKKSNSPTIPVDGRLDEINSKVALVPS